MQNNDHLYRPCVGIILLNQDNMVFTGKRIDTKTEAWQLPQGGIDAGETPEQAFWREMFEEIGTDKAEIIGQLPDWLYYDLPEHIRPNLWNGQYIGQRQQWFVARFNGCDQDINIATEIPEFCDWQWRMLESISNMIVPFKKQLYEQIIQKVRIIIN